jgi:IPT/TIG domain
VVGDNGTILLGTVRGEPAISSIDPETKTAGDGDFTLTVNGNGFMSASEVRWNGVARTTTYVSPTELTAAIPASDIASPGTASVTVANPGWESEPMTFTITAKPPAPTVTSITPKQGVNNGVRSITNLAGTGFQTGATVRLEKSGAPTINATNVVVVSDTTITCKLNINGAPLGKYDVVVKNPDMQEGRLAAGFSVTDMCGQGAGAIMLGFGFMIGLLYIDKRRKRLQSPMLDYRSVLKG